MAENREVTRRKFLKASAAAGAAAAALPSKAAFPKGKAPAYIRNLEPSDTVRIGFIGVGVRGKQLMEYSGYPDPKAARERGRRGRRQRNETDNLPRPLNVRAVAVSDLYEGNRVYGKQAAGRGCKVYPYYEDMLADPDVDAVFIATSDHNHAPVGIDAAEAGKAVYSEKCFANSIEDAKRYRDTIKRTGIVFQLGHQTRSGTLMERARKALGGIGPDGACGKVTMIETFTNRNNPNGAWHYRIPLDASPETIDWDRFTGKGPKRDFDPDRFFRWRKYWDYGTGLTGDLLTHEMDSVQHITGLGIPDTAVGLGGNYYHWDRKLGAPERETPDTFQAILNYEKEEALVIYTATLANGWRREKHFLGRDGTMDMSGGKVRVFIDPDTDREAYRELIEAGNTMLPGVGDVATIEDQAAAEAAAASGEEQKSLTEQIREETSDTVLWTLDKGIYTEVIDGKEVNVTALHILNFVESIRADNKKTNCDVDMAFEEAVIAHMPTIAFRRGRRVRWDAKREAVVND